MKVNQNTRRFWQIVILAISVLACASWNQTTDLQKNINSNSQKNIMDHAKLRQASIHSTDSDKWVVCEASRMNALEPTNGEDVSLPSLFAGEASSSGQMDEANQNVENCNGMIHFTKLSQPSQKTSIVVGTPVFCQDTRNVTDVLQGQGYFSGFTKPLEAVDSANVLGQATSVSTADLPADFFQMSTLSADTVFNYVACEFAVCHSNNADAANASSATGSDANGSNVDDSYSDVIVLAVASGCSIK